MAAALDARTKLATRNAERARDGLPPLEFGVGLHRGELAYGNVGTEKRLDFTVIGSAVNRTSRLEGLTKALGVQVCASADFQAVCEQPMRSLGTHRLRGVPKPVEIYEQAVIDCST